MRSALLVIAALLASAPAAVAQAPGPQPPRGPRRERRLPPEERQRLLERFEKLPPEQQAKLRRLFDEKVRGKSPEDVERLREQLRARRRAQRGEHGPRHGPPGPRPDAPKPDAPKPDKPKKTPEQKAQHEAFIRQVLEGLTPAERDALKTMAPAERRAAMKAHVEAHRRALVERRLEHLPAEALGQLRPQLDALPPGERFKRVKEALDGHLRDRLRELARDPSLTPEERARRRDELLERLVPDAERRERMKQRIAAEWEKRQQQPPPRPNGPGRPPGPAGPGGPGPDPGPRRPGRR